MKVSWIFKKSFALVALIAPTLHAASLVINPTMLVLPSSPAATPFSSVPSQQTTSSVAPVVTAQQPAFTNTGTPTYPILGNTTVYSQPTLPTATLPASFYSTANVSQQIVSNFSSPWQSQASNVYNPPSYGGYGSSYGYSANPYAVTSSPGLSLGSGPVLTPVGMPGVQQALWQQVVLITTNNPTARASNGLFDPAATAPEPGTLLLLVAGLGTLIIVARKRRNIHNQA